MDIPTPAELAEIISVHRNMFGGYRMADEPATPAPTPNLAPAPAADPAPKETPKPTPPPAAPKVELNEFGFPASTPVADMAPEHQAAYWKHQSRKHETRQLEALGFDPDTIARIREDQKKNPKAASDALEDFVKRIDALEKDRDQARAEAAVAKAIATYHVPDEDAPLLEGLSGDVLTNLAKRLGQEAKTPAAPSTDGAGKVGAPVSGPKQIATREEYAALSPEERRAARKDGRLNQLMGIKN